MPLPPLFPRRRFLAASGAATATALAAVTGMPRLARAAEGRKLRVHFVNPGRSGDRFWQMVQATMGAAARQMDITLTTSWGERERERIIHLGLKAVSARPDYLVIVNEHRTALPVLEAAEAAGLPTFLLLNAFQGEELVRVGRPGDRMAAFAGSLVPDNVGAGHRIATRLVKEAAARGLARDGAVQVLAVTGLRATPAAHDRTLGLEQAMAALPEARLLDVVQVNWSREEARERALGLLRRWPGTGAIWCANDEMALGCADAAEALGLVAGRDLLLAGLNWSPEGLQAVADGRLLFSLGGHFLSGAWAMVMLRDLADGEGLALRREREVGFDFALLDAAGARTWTARHGNGDWGRVQFAAYRRPRGDYDFGPLRLVTDRSAS
ncbi:MAG: hypothetical protein RLY86_369 [Pseudomonadota bacterium]|jgi:ABC-type sugar transport system substrate-binding protein